MIMGRSPTVLPRGGREDRPEVLEESSGGIEDPAEIPSGNGFEHFGSAREYAGFEGDPRSVRSGVYRTAIAG
jgi:hypothetical protein